MSDSGGNGFGEALESMTTNTKQALGGTLADFTKSAKAQVTGSAGNNLSGSFTPQQVSNPNSAPNLSGGDLFSPDMLAGKQPQQSVPSQTSQQTQQGGQNAEGKTPEELDKMQKIKAELAQMKQTMHQKYYQDFLAKAEGRDRKTQVEAQEKEQKKEEEKMEDLQKKEEKKQQDDQLMRAQRATENKGGGLG